MVTGDESGSGSKSNKQRFEAFEENQEWLFKSLAELTTSLAHMAMTNQESFERIERRLAENKEKEPVNGRTHGIRLPPIGLEYKTDEKDEKLVRVQKNKELTIGVVSPHTAQVVAIEDTLGHKDKNIDGFTVKVKSVDGFQDESGSGSKSNKQRFEALEENQEWLFKSLAELTTSLAHMAMTNQESFERIERRLAENKEKEPVDGRTHGIRLPPIELEYKTDEKDKKLVRVQKNKELTIGVVSPHTAQVVAIEDTLGHKDKNIDGFTVKVK
ncbi:hypothetical protein JRO89_XS07G0140000 [Xanthoceras sorbifolium]|uniref:Uncharacterized protein n=1 Tax=Xanthoceras sorbifolium TaxID=99658 RepID=A0ABQ8HTS9_9ROSI|nr:hypothetical protein JRO89_XS07G0140000 [Xanthoceras sorbifolium]